MVDYLISSTLRGKKLVLPESCLESVCNVPVKINVPKEAYYLCVKITDPLKEDGTFEDIDDDLMGTPYIIYLNNQQQNVGTNYFKINIDVFSLDKRLELLFNKSKV